ncbi:hypothetical protein PHYBLDRAFT_161486 [Phycomyces blakesleeanus NRRL 1555(-)]|uniref:Uncharacterized protein n=1 Tax=Phycomyces blakesleeanus (strain ATCC 8743b / DSM 1359 / FGSC 10004 / NBRC 33097 / NRRL 1555) TaxID=763407 RepID=A0A167R4X0_PHYB8|nr:hypothetical protein PHYBLDRAFT_161486 [Phycomyces blakesleeanus NRRL 1555(-)]OAD80848.1 hypothetical protein PHYBLDRAFT_161486 [Phycomyces blakesleeanus NRRL 1555(-)]|eukprot:XP_018298888.1 hypothetical protein PHYBLDRAFT_161486 [Phycomyces blakesleeanus NRRL 1555(-)]
MKIIMLNSTTSPHCQTTEILLNTKNGNITTRVNISSGTMAQWTRRLTTNQEIPGSTPGSLTLEFPDQFGYIYSEFEDSLDQERHQNDNCRFQSGLFFQCYNTAKIDQTH